MLVALKYGFQEMGATRAPGRGRSRVWCWVRMAGRSKESGCQHLMDGSEARWMEPLNSMSRRLGGSSMVLSIHADEVPDFPDCGVVGYYGPGGFTTWREEASVEIGGNGAIGIEIRLPATPDELCRGQTMVTGTLLGPDGEPIEGFGIGLIEAERRGSWPRKWGETGPDGSFGIRLLAGQSGSFIVGIYANEEDISTICNLLDTTDPAGSRRWEMMQRQSRSVIRM